MTQKKYQRKYVQKNNKSNKKVKKNVQNDTTNCNDIVNNTCKINSNDTTNCNDITIDEPILSTSSAASTTSTIDILPPTTINTLTPHVNSTPQKHICSDIESRSQKIQKKSIIVHLPINLTHIYHYQKPQMNINNVNNHHEDSNETPPINTNNTHHHHHHHIKLSHPVSFNLHESTSVNPSLHNTNNYFYDDKSSIDNNSFISDNKLFQKTIVELLSTKHYYNNNNNACNISCWHCHDKIKSKPIPLPVKIEKDKFFIKGYFCSFNCVLTYNFDSNERETTIQEREGLIRMMYKMYCKKQLFGCCKSSNNNAKSKCNKHSKHSKMPFNCTNNNNNNNNHCNNNNTSCNAPPLVYAPSKDTLKIFGGTLSYEEFHQNHQRNVKVTYQPLIPLVCFLEENVQIVDNNVIGQYV